MGSSVAFVESKQARLTAGTESVATAAGPAVCASSRWKYLLPTRHLSRSDGRRGESEGPRSMGWPYLLPRHKLCEVAPGDGLVSQASRRGEARCNTNHTATCVGGVAPTTCGELGLRLWQRSIPEMLHQNKSSVPHHTPIRPVAELRGRRTDSSLVGIACDRAHDRPAGHTRKLQASGAFY